MPTFSFSFGKNDASVYLEMMEQAIDTLSALETIVLEFEERIARLERRMNALNDLEQNVTEQDEELQDKFTDVQGTLIELNRRFRKLELEPMPERFDEDIQSALVVLEIVMKDHEERLKKLDGGEEFLKWVKDEDEQIVGTESDDDNVSDLRSGHEDRGSGAAGE